jgi:glutamate-1-semialdehyde 2,1-aminomutase
MAKYLDWHDYDAIHKQAGEVIHHRKKLKQSAIDRYMAHFDTKCKTSKMRYEQAQKVIPGGIQHNLANNHPFPISMDRAEGIYLYDEDGNRYIDMLMAGGPIILGNNYPAVRDACVELIKKKGPLTGLYSDNERLLSELIGKYMPSVEMFRMLGSGTEADIIAARLARAYTKKKEIIRVRGGYHGWSDLFVYNDGETSGDMLNGIPADSFKYTHAVPPNDIEAAEKQFAENEKRGGTAAFFQEAIGQDSGAVPTTVEYHKEIENLCKKYGALLVYDEVVTAFRFGIGGAQAVFETKPDITVFGKIIGGGYPCAGGVGGRRDVIGMLAAGINKNRADKVRVGGTLSANPLTALAGITTINELVRLNAHPKIAAAAGKIMKGLAAITDKYDVPVILFNHESILHIDVTGLQHIPTFYKKEDPEYARHLQEGARCAMEFAMALAAEGLIISGGGKTYLCYDSIPVADDILAVYDKVFAEFE